MRQIFLGLMVTIIAMSNIHSVEAKPKTIVETNTEVVTEEVHSTYEETTNEGELGSDTMGNDDYNSDESDLNEINDDDDDLEIHEDLDDDDDSWIEDDEDDEDESL